MYQADRFLELARENLGEQVSEEIVEEIREVRRREIMARNMFKEHEYLDKNRSQLHYLQQETEKYHQQMMMFTSELNMLQQEKSVLERQRVDFKDNKHQHLSDGKEFDDDSFMKRYSELTEGYHKVRSKLDLVEIRYREMQSHRMEIERELKQRQKLIDQEMMQEI